MFVFSFTDLMFFVLIMFFAGFWIGFLLVWLKLNTPQGRALAKIQFKHLVCELQLTDDGRLDVVGAKPMGEGFLDVKKMVHRIPRNPAAFVSKVFTWAKTRIPVFINYAGKVPAVSPATLAMIEAMDIGEPSNKPKKKKGNPTSKTESIFALDPRKIIAWFSGSLDANALFTLLEKRFLAGQKSAGTQHAKLAIPIIGILIAAAVLLLVIFLVSGGKIPFVGGA